MATNNEMLFLMHKLKGLTYVLNNFIDSIDNEDLKEKHVLAENEILDYCVVITKSLQEALNIVEKIRSNLKKF